MQAPVLGNIPIELLKALVLVADLGSVTRAARALGVTQSAVSAQMRRLEAHASGAVFIKQGRGVQLSELGNRISSFARRIVAISDQLQLVLAASSHDRSIRVGLPTGIDSKLIAKVFGALTSALDHDPVITCDSTANLLRQLDAGFIDAAFLLDIAPIAARVAVAWTERWHWIKAPHFVLSPGAPIPLISCPGSLADRVSIAALRRAGINYRIKFTSADLALRVDAVAAGIGLAVVSSRSVKLSNLCVARDYYLPPIPELHGGIHLADDFEDNRSKAVRVALEAVLRPSETT